MPQSSTLAAFRRSAVIFVFAAGLSLPQTPSAQPNASRFNTQQPAVPPDPLELVTGDAQPVQTARQRANVRDLLTHSLALSNVRVYPYHRITAFTAFGATSSDGAWKLDDMSSADNTYRWAAQGPSYSATNLYLDQTLYSSEPSGNIPLRLAQVRTAIFFIRPVVGPHATLRSIPAELNGNALTCVLLSHMGAARGATGGRHWSEAEYCIDNRAGALVIFSPVPGLYTLYDYSSAIHFHDRIIPNKFTISEAGRTIIEAQTVSVTDPPQDPVLFQTAGLTQVGVGSLMSAPWNYSRTVISNAIAAGSTQVVALEGLRSASGAIESLEVLASSDSTFNQTAIETASKSLADDTAADTEPGATPQSHAVFFIVTFAGNSRN